MANFQNYYFRQPVTAAELIEEHTNLENADLAIVDDHNLNGPITGLVVTESGPPALTVDVSAGVGYDGIGRRLSVPSLQIVPVNVDSLGNPTAVVGPGNERFLTISLQFDRQLLDQRTDGNGLPIFFDQPESFDIIVTSGVEALIGAASRPLPTDLNDLVLASVRLVNGQTTVVDADIDTNLRDTYLLQTIDDRITSNDADITAIQARLDANETDLLTIAARASASVGQSPDSSDPLRPIGLGMSVSGNDTDLDVTISQGVVTFDDGTDILYHHLDTDVTATVDTADATNPRLDILTAKVDRVETLSEPVTLTSGSPTTTHYDPISRTRLTLTLVTGTPAASPVEPAVPGGEYKFATIFVPANETALDNVNHVYDQRQVAGGGKKVFTMIDSESSTWTLNSGTRTSVGGGNSLTVYIDMPRNTRFSNIWLYGNALTGGTIAFIRAANIEGNADTIKVISSTNVSSAISPTGGARRYDLLTGVSGPVPFWGSGLPNPRASESTLESDTPGNNFGFDTQRFEVLVIAGGAGEEVRAIQVDYWGT